MRYQELLPSEPLRDLVRCYWFLRDDSQEPGSAEPALPDGSPELILNLADPFLALDGKGPEREQPLVFLVGQITGPYRVRPSGRVDLVGVRLEAFGASWLAGDLRPLTDEFVDLADAFGGALERLRCSLVAIPNDAARATRLDAELPALVAQGRTADWRVAAAVRAIRTSHGLVDLADLAEQLKTTPRTLQRHFGTDVGITPKLLARIVRFQRVFTEWRADPKRLSRVAAECGYFDHAHLVRDFRELAGVPPAAFLPNQPEFTGFFTS